MAEDLKESARPARDPQLRAHVRRTPSSRSSATRGGTVRRCASAWSTSPSWPVSPADWTTTRSSGTAASSASVGLPTTYRGDRWPGLLRRDAAGQEDPRRRCCGSWCSTAWRGPRVLEGPDPALLSAAYAEVSRDRGASAADPRGDLLRLGVAMTATACWSSTAPTSAGWAPGSRRSTAPRPYADLVDRRHPRGRRPGPGRRRPPDQRRGRADRLAPRGRRRRRGRRAQPGRVHPLLLRPARRLRAW